MENASYALLMAGGVLIALLIIGVLVLMFTQLGSVQQTQSDLTKNSQIAEFNNQFEPYNKDGLTLLELKSIYNKIESNNESYPEYKITSNIQDLFNNQNIKLSGETAISFDMFLNSFRQIPDSYKNKINLTFKCSDIEYNGTEGRISVMKFLKN